MTPTTFPCPHCSFTYEVDADYLAAYGGQETTCTACHRPMTIPRLAAPAGGQPSGEFPQQYQQQAQYGYGPGAYSQPPMAVLGYAAPDARPPVGLRAWRDGNELVVASLTELPDRCVKCNAPATGRPFKRTFYWHEPWVFATILLGLLVYVIVALATRKSGRLTFSLCESHRSKRTTTMVVGWVVAAASVGLFFLAVQMREWAPVSFGIIGVITGLIVVVTAGRVLTARKIGNSTLWLRGAGKPFLQTLPSVRGPPGVGARPTGVPRCKVGESPRYRPHFPDSD